VSLDARLPVLAAAVGVAVLALGGAFLLLGRGGGGSSSTEGTVIAPLHPVKKHVVTTAKPKATATKTATTAKAPAKAPVKKAVKTTAVAPKTLPKPKAKPKAAARRHVPAVIDGMPSALALALHDHRVVVLSLFTPGSSVDTMSTDEARHGAAEAQAGFVALSVADEKVVSPLSSLLSGAATPADRVLDGPAVLVFQRPNTLFVRFNGFADRDTVAQAAANALTLAR
jgi:hypothetical protein